MTTRGTSVATTAPPEVTVSAAPEATKQSSVKASTETSRQRIATLLHTLDAEKLSQSQQLPVPPAVWWLQVFLAIVLGACLVVVLLHLQRHSRTHAAPMCRSQGCLYHAELIERHVNRSVDPCHDFDAFACSKWTAGRYANSYGTALMSRHMTTWFKDFNRVLEEGSKLIPAGVRALRMFEQCMSDVDEASAKQGIRELKSFMSDRRIPWPAPPLPGVQPLGVLLDLAYNWRLGLWFDASSLPSAIDEQGRHHWSLLIEHGKFAGTWALQNKDVVRGHGYTTYWNSLRNAFSDGWPTGQTRQSNIDEIAARETEILSALFTVARSTMKKPSRFRIQDIERYTPNISTSVWNSVIEKSIGSAGGIATFERLPSSVTVSDVAVIGVINTLYAKYTREQILEHIAWFFVQVFASLADRKFLVSKYGSEALADYHRREYCATEVEQAYRFLVVALYSMQRFSTETRAMIDLQLESVKETALEKFASGRPSWAGNSSRELVAAKVSNLRTLLWPTADRLNETDLLDMLGHLSTNQSSFLEHWFDVFYAKRDLLAGSRYAAAMKMSLNFLLPYFHYDYISNTVLVSVAALARPLYDGNGTAAMTYGGLGYSYAAQLVRAFDTGGMAVDVSGNIAADSWASPSWQQGSLAKLECLKPLYDSPFREIPALEIAHSAFRRALGNDSELLRLVTLDFTEEQVFFITACFTLCTIPSPGGRFFGGDCNKAARNYAPFAKAFGCRDGARMKPTNPCSYFD